ncbi:phenylalanine--tRNA ligase subunit beta [Flexithrix dorotheae]|uniref:phenylalanine--tRNA ligase subunit beta n=1 Tax=Flexithrix dorotheae TaxID=70993 RepID=UPI00037D8362|nr:phenylalanine--tRNA ligase subunit beta [Flexithrix dorotheae]
MKISIDWLKTYIELTESPEELDKLLTSSGLEVEGVEEFESVKGGLKGLVIGEVMACEKHPGADKLSITKVDIGGEELSPIVCGAPNVAAGQKVVVATVGATLYPAGSDPFVIKKAKIRGEVSLGMICAEDEIGLGESHDGIMVLDTDLPNGTPAAEFFQLQSDYVLEIGLTPNRVDGASHYGVARDLKVLLDRPLKSVGNEALPESNNELPIEVVVENEEACPRYAGVTINNIQVKESPDWLKNRLKAIGLAPINNVVDATNYILHGLGQPLHAFDAAKIKGNKVIVKTLPEGTSFTTLDEEERKLSANDLMICNAEEPMCIAGVFGGVESGVTESTTSIFLESAYFDPAYIRRSSQYHTLKTDAAFRFERGIDPNGTVKALKVAANLIIELAGGNISSEITDLYPNPIQSFEVDIKYKNVDRLIGKVLDRDLIQKILTGLDIEIVSKSEVGLKLAVPPYRVDVQREADVIEEILRIYGYDNIEVSENLNADYLAEFPQVDPDKIKGDISQMLSGAGFQEMMTNSLTKASYVEELVSYSSENDVVILNALSEDLGVMRQTLLFSGLEVLAYNINRRQKDLKLYEFGRSYHKKEDNYTENSWLSIFVTGAETQESWRAKTNPVSFHSLSAIVNALFAKMNFDQQLSTEVLEEAGWDYGLIYKINQKEVAKVGKVNAKLAKKSGIGQEVFYAEVDWDYLLKKFNPKIIYSEIPKFPEVRRDLSLVMDKKLTFNEIKNFALRAERNILKSINVFDIYEGDNLGEGKKSYSVSFILQDPSKTLNDKQIDKTMNKLINGFEREFGILIRK